MKLAGAAKKAHDKRVLLDRAASMTAAGHSPLVVAALLVAAEETHPTRNPEPLREDIAAALAPSQDELRRRFKAAVRNGRAHGLSHAEPLVVIRETGHGIHHGSYRADVPLPSSPAYVKR